MRVTKEEEKRETIEEMEGKRMEKRKKKQRKKKKKKKGRKEKAKDDRKDKITRPHKRLSQNTLSKIVVIDRPPDRPTDIACYRVACTRLKR